MRLAALLLLAASSAVILPAPVSYTHLDVYKRQPTRLLHQRPSSSGRPRPRRRHASRRPRIEEPPHVSQSCLLYTSVPDDEIDARVRQILSFVGLERTFAFYPSSLSGGMKRRVAIARAAIRQPELMLYDSPTGGLDPVTSTTIIELIVKERDVHKTPALLVTHRLQDAFTMCTHYYDQEKAAMLPLPEGQTNPNTTFLMLDEGRLIFDGTIHDLVHSKDPFVREFIE